MKKTINIALDGPSGSGKSTIAKLSAKELDCLYIDTGALYRAIGLYVLQNNVADTDTAGVIALLDKIDLRMELIDGGGAVFLGGKRLFDEIRTPEVTRYASNVSKIPEVRAFLLHVQQDTARKHNVIMDGRDIGTVVLPDAQVKIFMTADAPSRARRRYEELLEKGQSVTYEEVLADVEWRDQNDRERTVAPAVPAADAVMHDNSGMTIEQNLQAVLAIIHRKLGS